MINFQTLLKSRCFIYVLLAFFCLFLAGMSLDYDYDLFARLIVGEYFFANGSVSYEDFLSYTPTHIWYDHEWGSSVVFYAFFKLLGPFGLVLVQALTMFITAFFVIKTQRLQKHPYPISIAFMVLFLLLFSHQNPSIVRCHMFSFMFFSMLLYFLEKTRLKNSNLLWLMLPITIIWNNLHGGIVSGLGIIFIYMIGAILTKRPWRKYFAVLTLSTLLLIINPYGIEYLEFLLSANTKNREYITEWWGVFVQRHAIYYYPIFCLGIFAILLNMVNIINRKKFNITKILMLFTTVLLGTLHVKLLSLPLIVISSLYYNEIVGLFNKAGIKFLNKLVTICLMIVVCYIPFSNPNLPKLDYKKFPIQEVEFIKLNNLKGNILTAFGLGSYVSYKLYPNNLIFMDGRYEEVYYDREFDALIRYEKGEQGWDDVLNYYETDILLPEKSMPIYNFLKSQKDWIEIFSGPCSGVFVKKAGYKKPKGGYIIPPETTDYYEKHAFDNFGKFGRVNNDESF